MGRASSPTRRSSPSAPPPPAPQIAGDGRLRLESVLERSRSRGFLGPGPLGTHVEQALGFACVLDGPSGSSSRSRDVDGGRRLLDLGSGGGLPGLVVAMATPGWQVTLLDANGRRTAFLRVAVEDLELAGRVGVSAARAEDAGRCEEMRGRFIAVVARGFGPPAVTAECAAPFLRVGGVLVVSEPPSAKSSRWAVQPLAALGLSPAEPREANGFRFALLRQLQPCPRRFPRRVGVAAKRPLF